MRVLLTLLFLLGSSQSGTAQIRDDESGRPEDAETKAEHPTKPLDQNALALPLDLTSKAEGMRLGEGLFPAELTPLVPEIIAGFSGAAEGMEEPPNASLAEMLAKLATRPASPVVDPLGVLDFKEAQAWTAFAEGVLKQRASELGEAAGHFHIIAAPVTIAPDKLKALADAWYPAAPAQISWIEWKSGGQQTAVCNNALEKVMPGKFPSWSLLLGDRATVSGAPKLSLPVGLHWKDHGRLLVSQQIIDWQALPGISLAASPTGPTMLAASGTEAGTQREGSKANYLIPLLGLLGLGATALWAAKKRRGQKSKAEATEEPNAEVEAVAVGAAEAKTETVALKDGKLDAPRVLPGSAEVRPKLGATSGVVLGARVTF